MYSPVHCGTPNMPASSVSKMQSWTVSALLALANSSSNPKLQGSKEILQSSSKRALPPLPSSLLHRPPGLCIRRDPEVQDRDLFRLNRVDPPPPPNAGQLVFNWRLSLALVIWALTRILLEKRMRQRQCSLIILLRRARRAPRRGSADDSSTRGCASSTCCSRSGVKFANGRKDSLGRPWQCLVPPRLQTTFTSPTTAQTRVRTPIRIHAESVFHAHFLSPRRAQTFITVSSLPPAAERALPYRQHSPRLRCPPCGAFQQK